MAKFADTPKWKTKPKSDQPIRASTLKPRCPICGARSKMPCKTPDGTTRRAHPERRAKASRAAKNRQRLKTLQRRRWAGVTVRYVCPICGGDHPRAKCMSRAA